MNWDHPRIRGEHASAAAGRIHRDGSSPHTRGARNPCPPTGSCRRIIPAYAGSTPPAPSSRGPERDHPRIRGEHIKECREELQETGSSPHTRGALRQQRLPRLGGGIIPAYAGSTYGAGKRRFA